MGVTQLPPAGNIPVSGLTPCPPGGCWGAPGGRGGCSPSCFVPLGSGPAPAWLCRGAGGCPREGCPGAGGPPGIPAEKGCYTLCCCPSWFPCRSHRARMRPVQHPRRFPLAGVQAPMCTSLSTHIAGKASNKHPPCWGHWGPDSPSPRLRTQHQPGANLTREQRSQGLGRVGAAPPARALPALVPSS